jgi:hypothetical protein
MCQGLLSLMSIVNEVLDNWCDVNVLNVSGIAIVDVDCK